MTCPACAAMEKVVEEQRHHITTLTLRCEALRQARLDALRDVDRLQAELHRRAAA